MGQQWWTRLRAYWQMAKPLQTGLLVWTGLAGYWSAQPGLSGSIRELLGLLGSLFLAVTGSTVLNMWYDRDIDAQMPRTQKRPIPSGRVSPQEALVLGLALLLLGVAWAFWLHPLYGGVVLTGALVNVVVYTIWLKRRSAWSILWGGISGAMPVLAGRVLALGRVDDVGLLMALAVLVWIPIHNVTFGLHFDPHYRVAGVPTISRRYGVRFAYGLIALSAVLSSGIMLLVAYRVGVRSGFLLLLVVLSLFLTALAASTAWKASRRLNYLLFKFASLYMLGSMLLIAWGV